jgi:hypothetical protein
MTSWAAMGAPGGAISQSIFFLVLRTPKAMLQNRQTQPKLSRSSIILHFDVDDPIFAEGRAKEILPSRLKCTRVQLIK